MDRYFLIFSEYILNMYVLSSKYIKLPGKHGVPIAILWLQKKISLINIRFAYDNKTKHLNN